MAIRYKVTNVSAAVVTIDPFGYPPFQLQPRDDFTGLFQAQNKRDLLAMRDAGLVKLERIHRSDLDRSDDDDEEA